MIENYIEPASFLYLFLRISTGVVFFIQGYDKVFKIGINEIIKTVGPSYKSKGFPDFSIKITSFLTSWLELTGGLLLILGFLKYTAIYLLGIDVLIVIIGMSILDPVWDMKLVFPRLILLVLLLLLPAEKDILSLDILFFNKDVN